MWSRADVDQIVVEQPDSWVAKFLTRDGYCLVDFGDVAWGKYGKVPSSWEGLVSASGDEEFYQQLFLLWDKGCAEGAYSPQFLRSNIRFAGFGLNWRKELGIIYLVKSYSTEDVWPLFGSVPASSEELELHEDYGVLTQFVSYMHKHLVDYARDSFGLPELGRFSYSWERFMEEESESDNDDQGMIYTDRQYGWDDPRRENATPPDLKRTLLYVNRQGECFVEPGDPVKFWKYWAGGDFELELQNYNDLYPAVDPVDYNLAIILGGEPNRVNRENKASKG